MPICGPVRMPTVQALCSRLDNCLHIDPHTLNHSLGTALFFFSQIIRKIIKLCSHHWLYKFTFTLPYYMQCYYEPCTNKMFQTNYMEAHGLVVGQ